MNDKKVEPDRYRIFKADNDDKKKIWYINR